jgi:hypothetical protein
MASAAHTCDQARQAQDNRFVIDAIPTLAWSARSDGSADFFNQRWLDYTGLFARILPEVRNEANCTLSFRCAHRWRVEPCTIVRFPKYASNYMILN